MTQLPGGGLHRCPGDDDCCELDFDPGILVVNACCVALWDCAPDFGEPVDCFDPDWGD